MQSRHAAVARGLTFVRDYIAEDTPRRAILLGEQCVAMFYDVWSSAEDEALCEMAKESAVVLLTTLEVYWFDNWPLPWSERQLLEVLAIVRYEALGVDISRLLARVDDSLASIDMRHLTLPAAQHADWQTGQLSSNAWFDVMSTAFTYEYAALIYPDRFLPPPRVGLREVLAGLRRHAFDPPCQPSPGSDFGEASYLATHAYFWLSAYAPTIDLNRDAPWLETFVRRTLEFWLSQAVLRDAATPGNGRDGLVYADLDAVGECLDVLSCSVRAGRVHGREPDEALSALLERAGGWLVSMQQPDGSWPHIPFPINDPLRVRLMHLPNEDSVDEYSQVYDRLHATWTVLTALCDRRPAAATPDGGSADGVEPRLQPAQRHAERMVAIMRDVGIAQQLGVPKGKRGKSRSQR